MIFWKKLAERLEENHKVILLLVVEHHGSSPGKQGFKMLVDETGYLYGSIGGGRTEYNLAEEAKALSQNGINKAFFKNQIHRDEEEDSSGMICAGEQLVLFYPINKQMLPEINSILEKKEGVLEITESVFRLHSKEKLPSDFEFNRKNNAWSYKENINRKSYVYIVGGGHVGLAVARLFQMLDFETTMLDDRKNLNTYEANIYSDYKHVIDYNDIADYIPERDNTYIIILTHGYKADTLIFSKLLHRNYKYIGLLGSKAKIAAMFKSMMANGCKKEALQKADAPIGIDINSKTPEEIAVSIAAKIIEIRNTP